MIHLVTRRSLEFRGCSRLCISTMEAFFSRKLTLPFVAAALLLQDAAEAVQNVGFRRQLVIPHSFAEAERSNEACYFKGKEYYGDELSEFVNVPDFQQCQELCGKHSHCAFFTFIEGQGKCRLHSREPKQNKDNPNALAGKKRCTWCSMEGYDFKGVHNKTDGGERGISSLAKCQTSCEADPKCKAYLFDTSKNLCHFKTGDNPVNSLAPQGNYIAGPKSCKRHWCILKKVNLPNDDISLISAGSAEDCQNSCFGEEKCTHFSFHWPSKQCWLKQGNNIFNKKTAHDGFESGTAECGLPKYCVKNGQTYRGNVVGSYPSTVTTSFRACVENCANEPRCVFITYNQSYCTLFGTNATMHSDPNSKSADLTC